MSNNIIEFIPRDEWEKTLAAEAEKPGGIKLTRELNRKRVTYAFLDAFELLGGVQRMIHWASASDENYGTFLKLYSKLLPSQSDSSLDIPDKQVIQHVLPKGKLDL